MTTYAIASEARKIPEAWSWSLKATGMISPSPKPIITLSRPSVSLKSETTGTEPPDPINTASLPHSSLSARFAAASKQFDIQTLAAANADFYELPTKHCDNPMLVRCANSVVYVVRLDWPRRPAGTPSATSSTTAAR